VTRSPRKTVYRQFCPVAQAAEVVAERWNPLILRELLCGCRRFNEIRRGVPAMSPSLLSSRLRDLERAGVVEKGTGEDGSGTEYHLTEAGEELRPVIEQLGVWGQRWAPSRLDPENLDPEVLMWDVRRRIDTSGLPADRLVVEIRFSDRSGPSSRFWLVLASGEVDLCLKDPGHEVDLWLVAELRVLTAVWLGDLPFESALEDGRIELQGPASLRRDFPSWLSLSLFAGVERPERTGG
jgi:DNA-binding HxlR family transcriptional regulator